MGTNKTIDLDKAIDMPANGIDVIPTGIPSLDEMLGGGLRRGSLTVIASRPGMGKTSLALQIAENLAATGRHVLFFELEMLKEQIVKFACRQRGGTPTLDTLYFDDTGDIDPIYIRRQLRSVGNCDAVFVDYLQLLMSGPGWPVWDGGGRGIRALKALAGSEIIPVIVTSQLPRPDPLPSERESYHRPILSDLGILGIPVSYADVVIFPFRESYYSEEESEINEKAELIVAKNRYGATGVIPVYWDHEKIKIEEKSE